MGAGGRFLNGCLPSNVHRSWQAAWHTTHRSPPPPIHDAMPCSTVNAGTCVQSLARSVVWTPGQHLLASGTQQDGVLVLGHERSPCINQRGVRFDDARLHQALEAKQVLVLTQLVQPLAAEGQRIEVLHDEVQELLTLGVPQGGVGVCVLADHVVRALEVLTHVTLASATEGLDGKQLPLLHLCIIPVLHDGDRLACMDQVRPNGVAVQIPHAFDGVHLPVQLNFMGLHRLLDCGPDVTQPDINASLTDPRVGGCLHSFLQGIINGIERHSPCTVNDSAIDLGPEINLAHIVPL
mmetsp:Transcript_112515/g.195396  ORF Transcript_112515/g.195396 Transcript_112515/m.195396 type:complete len:294 (+) Transcript_112515:360-1241(+)